MFESSSLAFYMAPIAVTLCFGLAFATGLVLLVIPALLTLLEASREQINRRAGKLAAGLRTQATWLLTNTPLNSQSDSPSERPPF
jgi:hypothetical protein